MAKYQIYSNQTATNNNWVKLIPTDWKIVPLKYMCHGFVKDGPHETPEFIDVGVPFLSVDGIQNNKLVFDGCRYVSTEDDARFSLKCKPQKGDILLGKAASVGKVAFVESDKDFNVWSPLAVIRPKDIKLGKFIYYCLQSYELQLQCDIFSNSNTQKNLGMTTIDNLSFPYPSIEEAEKISEFLDHETAKIDSLIEKQQQLIQLLKEKRQAVISHAVTKGLDPRVKMKDSGVEWLGEVPEHWEVSKIQYYAKIESGHTPSKSIEKYWENCTIPWISLNDSKQLRVVDYISDTAFEISELGLANSSARILPKNTVVFTRDASIGLSAITTKEMAVSQHLIAWLPKTEKLCPEFLLLIFYAMEKEFDRYTFGSTIKTIGMDNIRSLTATFPSLVEQKKIVDWCFNQFKTIDKSIAKSNALLTILRERRTALISAAVTGKIDVRNWQNPNNNNEAKTEFSA